VMVASGWSAPRLPTASTRYTQARQQPRRTRPPWLSVVATRARLRWRREIP
jgi:hypothetical protein